MEKVAQSNSERKNILDVGSSMRKGPEAAGNVASIRNKSLKELKCVE